MRLPRDQRLDRRLMATLGVGRGEAPIFVIAMVLGVLAFELLEWRNRAPAGLAGDAVPAPPSVATRVAS